MESGAASKIYRSLYPAIIPIGLISPSNCTTTDDGPIYIFRNDDPVGQKLEGVRVLIDRYRSAGLASIAHDFYSDGRHEMLHEINRRDVITNLLIWISGILKEAS